MTIQKLRVAGVHQLRQSGPAHQRQQHHPVYTDSVTYDANGHLLPQTYGNTVQTIQNYNAANGRITSITAGAGNAVQNFTYAYDNLGNITTRSDGNQSLTETFSYDTLNRLQTAQVNAPTPGIVTTSYAYARRKSPWGTTPLAVCSTVVICLRPMATAILSVALAACGRMPSLKSISTAASAEDRPVIS